jgi:hypothetical protein
MTYIDFDFNWSIIVYHGNLRYSNSYVVMQYKVMKTDLYLV